MSDNLANMAGMTCMVTINEVEYKTRPLKVDDLARFEVYVRERRIKEVKKAITDNVEQSKAIVGILTTPFEDGEIAKEMNTISGAQFMLWRVLSENKDMTLEKVGTMVYFNDLADVMKIINQSGGDKVDPTDKDKEANKGNDSVGN